MQFCETDRDDKPHVTPLNSVKQPHHPDSTPS